MASRQRGGNGGGQSGQFRGYVRGYNPGNNHNQPRYSQNNNRYEQVQTENTNNNDRQGQHFSNTNNRQRQAHSKHNGHGQGYRGHHQRRYQDESQGHDSNSTGGYNWNQGGNSGGNGRGSQDSTYAHPPGAGPNGPRKNGGRSRNNDQQKVRGTVPVPYGIQTGPPQPVFPPTGPARGPRRGPPNQRLFENGLDEAEYDNSTQRIEFNRPQWQEEPNQYEFLAPWDPRGGLTVLELSEQLSYHDPDSMDVDGDVAMCDCIGGWPACTRRAMCRMGEVIQDNQGLLARALETIIEQNRELQQHRGQQPRYQRHRRH